MKSNTVSNCTWAIKLALLSVCCLLLMHSKQLHSQEVTVFHVNSKNGLSTNHVYFAKTDRLGYLWIGTTDGLYRYNGYQFKKYSYDDGLTSTDVWSLTEDTKGRLWLHSIAPTLGYVQNNVYHKVSQPPTGEVKTIYPLIIAGIGDSTCFSNRIQASSTGFEYGIVYNDTLYWREVYNKYGASLSYFIGDKIVEIFDERVARGFVSKLADRLNGNEPEPVREINQGAVKLLIHTNVREQFNKNALMFNFGDSCVNFYDTKSDSLTVVQLTDSTGKPAKLTFTIPYKDSCYVFVNDIIVAIDTNFIIRGEYKMNALFPNLSINPTYNTYFINDKNWGKCLSTSENGLFIQTNRPVSMYKSDIQLEGFKFVNVDRDTGYWWSSEQHILKKIGNAGGIQTTHKPEVQFINKVKSINKDIKLTLYKNFSIFEYSGRELIPYTVLKYPYLDGKAMSRDYIYTRFNNYIIDFVPVDTNCFYEIATGGKGLNKITFSTIDSTIFFENIDNVRYESGCYNNKLDKAVFCSKNRVTLVDNKTMKLFSLGNDVLSRYNVRGIEKVALDDYGNVYVKDYNSLRVYNIHTHKLKSLFENYNLEKTWFDLTDNVLTLAGPFGVVRCQVVSGQLVKLRNYPNVKNIYYNLVTDAQVLKDGVLLKTDNGVYFVDTNSEVDSAEDNHTVYLVSYNDTLQAFQDHDTIKIAAETNSINLDLIRPTGSGSWGGKYILNGKEYANSTNEILVRDLTAGTYHKIVVTFYDDSWVSRPVSLYVYVIPHWWQSVFAARVIFACSVFLLIGLIYLVIVVTKRIVNRNNERRNQQSSLELKSIHSQINPHFIFNTLSTALYYVNRNENENAFRHISQFSELLQSYIKSSRNKYISIAEEVDNLENYLELQLTRFEDKFVYFIRIDDNIDADNVKIPSLILQPLVENALNHGIFHKEGSGEIILSFEIDKYDSATLIIKVDDDGVGREHSKTIRPTMLAKANSYGSVLIKELVDVFNKYEKINISVHYIDKQEPLRGTTVVIKIKNYENAK